MDHDQPNSAASHSGTNQASSRATDAKRLMLGVVAGIVAGLVLIAALLILLRPAPLPALTAETLQAARDKWAQQGPPSYDMELVIKGREPGLVIVQVRDGEVIRMTRDGREPDQRRTWQYWSVPAQFDTLEEEMADVHKSGTGFADSATVHTRLEAQFDPKYGYPALYRRIVLGNDNSMSWEVIRFLPRTGGDASASPKAE